MKNKPGNPILLGVRINFETRHFNFEAFGRTEAEARRLLSETINNHVKQYSQGDARFDREVLANLRRYAKDANVTSMYVGGYRDYQKIA